MRNYLNVVIVNIIILVKVSLKLLGKRKYLYFDF